MSLSKSFKDADEFVGELRGLWQFHSSSLAEFIGFVSGFGLGRSIDTGPFWNKVQDAVASSSLPMPGSPFVDRVSAEAPSKLCEVPILFAVLDHASGRVFEEAWYVETEEVWRREYVEENERVSGGDKAVFIPTPYKLLLVPGSHGFWHIFFVSQDGARFYEANHRTKQRALAWAAAALRIPESSWIKRTNGFAA